MAIAASAEIFYFVGGENGSWREAASFRIGAPAGAKAVVPGRLPGGKDVVRLWGGVKGVTNSVTVSGADLAAMGRVKAVSVASAVLTLDVAKDCRLDCAIVGGNGTSNSWARAGKVIKKGKGVLSLEAYRRYFASGRPSDYLFAHLCVAEGEVRLLPSKVVPSKDSPYLGILEVAALARLRFPRFKDRNSFLHCDGLRGQGLIEVPPVAEGGYRIVVDRYAADRRPNVFEGSVKGFLDVSVEKKANQRFTKPLPLPFFETTGSNPLGFRPKVDSRAEVNPVPFVWAPQRCERGYLNYDLEYAHEGGETVRVTNLVHNVYLPVQKMAPGKWTWRVRCTDPAAGRVSAWTKPISFVIGEEAKTVIVPDDATLFARIPQTHPRLFMRPEAIEQYRGELKGKYAQEFKNLVWRVKNFRKKFKEPEEPLKYDETMIGKGKARNYDWKQRWWGNRMYVMKYLDGAAELAFHWRLTDDVASAELAKKILLAAAKWDPKGATGYRYNDEAGMPFFSRFSRAYTFLWHYLSEEERAQIRRMMTIRGEEMYHHLCPRLFFNPCDSHGNRAWHFLGEGAVAFFDEIPEARKWLSFALDYYRTVYPVWGDSDGGWHEGPCYWTSYMSRFFWWGDIMRDTFGVNVFEKPLYSQAGDFALYQVVPGFRGVGFADCTEFTTIKSLVGTMSSLADLSGNPYWRWYADHEPASEEPYIAMLRKGLPKVVAKAPVDIPQSKLFRGQGLAFMNTCLTNALCDVQVLFKSDPTFGMLSHGFDAQNSFMLNAFGDRIFVHSGVRDCYGSEFHTNWMWHVKGVCSFAPTGDTQERGRRGRSLGRITDFFTSPDYDRVTGECGDIWENHSFSRHVRTIHFRKAAPQLVLIVDRAEAAGEKGVKCVFRLHTPEMPFDLSGGQHAVRVETTNTLTEVNFLWPEKLELSETDQFDPPLGFKRRLVEHHLDAVSAEPLKDALFVTLISPRRRNAPALPGGARIEGEGDAARVVVPLGDGENWTIPLAK